MSKEIQSSWMISPKSLIRLLGAEYHLMRDSGVLKRFYLSSLLIVIIVLITSISIGYALDLLFHTIVVEIVLAIFFCLLFLCIYTFLLNTFAKESRTKTTIFSLSNLIRIGFVAFMGFLIAQPLVILLYSATLAPNLLQHKQELLKQHTARINSLMINEKNKLHASQNYYLDQKTRFGTRLYDKELKKIASKLQTLNQKTTQLNQIAKHAIDHNSFFLFHVQEANHKYRLSWLLTFMIIVLFLLPGYLVYTISSQHLYYILKKAQEKEIVTKSYNQFCGRYKTMFNEQITIFSRYEDPPFNTVRKQPPTPASMTEFLQKYLHNA